MSIPQKVLISVSGNYFMQNVLEKTAKTAQYYMGIGSGDAVLTSGEQVIVNRLRRMVVPPYCIFDVGSNTGQFLQLILHSIASDDFSVHCFEPGGAAFKTLAASVKPDQHHIKLNNKAIGKEKGKAILHYNTSGSELASLTKRRLDHFGINFDKSETVEITTIDEYCSENDIHHIHLLKMDIEGHELDALAGAGRMFAENAIDMVSFEFGGCNIDTRTFFQDFWYFFHKKNMQLFRITPSGYLCPIDVYKEIHEQFRTTNFIAISGSQSR